VAGSLVLSLAGVGAYVELRPVPAGGAPPALSSQSPGDPGPTPIETPTPYPTPTAVPTPLGADVVLGVVRDHWNAIRDHRFEEAYGYLGPGVATDSESVWVSNHQRDGISDVQYEFQVRDVSGDAATVDIRTLRTWAQSAQDSGNPSGCLSWSGSYTLVWQGNRWLINQAHLMRAPC
jgi:hypothetical protein